MGWSDFYRRRDVLDGVLATAERNPMSPLPFAEIPHATTVFAGTDDLLLALHHKWTRLLTNAIGWTLANPDYSEHNRVDAVSAAWHGLAGHHPTLRRLLDEHL